MPARWLIIALALGVLVVLARPAVVQAAPEVQGEIGSIGVVGASASVTTTAPVPAGGSIIVVASASLVGGTTPACSDSVNGSYTVEREDGNSGSGAVIAVCARHNVLATPAGTSITVTWPGATGSTQNQIIAIAARGLAVAPLDRSTGTGPVVQTGSSLTTGSVSTTTSAAELLVGGFYVSSTAVFTAGSNGTASPCATSGTSTYTALPGVSASTFRLWVETCIVSAPGAYSAQGSLTAPPPSPPGTPVSAGYVGSLVTYAAPIPTATPTSVPTVVATATPTPPGATPVATATPAAATATPGPGGGGGEEPQDVAICEALPGGPRELRIKASEWPLYRERAARGPCPARGAPAIVRALPPAPVPGTAGILPPAPPAAAATPVVAPLRLERVGRVRVTLLGARSSWCDGDLLLLAPAFTPTPAPGTADGTLPTGARRLWSSYLRHVGASVEVGPYPAGTSLVLGLSPRGVCAPADGVPRASGGAFARVAPSAAPGQWDIWWEDFRLEGADFDDLVARVEVLPSSP